MPQMMYGCSIWSNARDNGRQTYTMTAPCEGFQAVFKHRAARAICPEPSKQPPFAALDVETFLLPIERQIEQDITRRLWHPHAPVPVAASIVQYSAHTAEREPIDQRTE